MTRREEHLKETAEKAAQFAAEFGSGDWAYLAGLWHDLGANLNILKEGGTNEVISYLS